MTEAPIPQDVRAEAAGWVVLMPPFHDSIEAGAAIDVVARAIMAEREACAGYHDDLAAQHEAFSETSPVEAAKHHKAMARRHTHYAAMIRKRGEG